MKEENKDTVSAKEPEKDKKEVKPQKVGFATQKTFFFLFFMPSKVIDRRVNNWIKMMALKSKPVMLGKITANIFGCYYVFLYTSHTDLPAK